MQSEVYMKSIRKIPLLCALLLLICFFSFYTKSVAFASGIDIFDKLDQIICGKQPEKQLEKVYLGGYPLGITLDGEGVTVVGLNEFLSQNGEVCCPALDSGLQIGDVITALDGKKIYNSRLLSQIASDSKGGKLQLDYIREGKLITTKILPQRDFSTSNYRLGLWTKDASSGVGTLTYVKQDNTFGCLGHPIADGKGKIVDAKNGGVYSCKIDDVVPGRRGQAGELHGSFEFDGKLGKIYLNNKFGVFGKFDENKFDMQLVDVLPKENVKMGKAKILTTVDGVTRQYFDIEIVKTCNQSCPDDKSMVIRVTDKNLIEKTGGIVQGMSGSPIVQDGKLVGAVTHVFVNDPTKGYGIYAEWMLQN